MVLALYLKLGWMFRYALPSFINTLPHNAKEYPTLHPSGLLGTKKISLAVQLKLIRHLHNSFSTFIVGFFCALKGDGQYFAEMN
jgi:hypothetical protein